MSFNRLLVADNLNETIFFIYFKPSYHIRLLRTSKVFCNNNGQFFSLGFAPPAKYHTGILKHELLCTKKMASLSSRGGYNQTHIIHMLPTHKTNESKARSWKTRISLKHAAFTQNSNHMFRVVCKLSSSTGLYMEVSTRQTNSR